ncbi:MAG: 23S rRNA (adenine(2503)-C(2))-methyltransferase RlmN [Treponema sp.]|nr:23S rRNA (adenine(2503)-C(2))-methyltransferase RlmN [Treponema sp.]
METQSLAGLPLYEIEKILDSLPRFRSEQVYKWISRGASCFNDMTDIPKSLQNEFEQRFKIFSTSFISCNEDGDAKKIIVKTKDGCKIESVLLSDGKNRFTACLSTQAGCPSGCVFCKTGSLGFKRNLDSKEIAEQFLRLLPLSGRESENDSHIIDNIVIMGMGEPLLNLDNLRMAISFFTDTKGLYFSRRRITVSTCGICEGLFDIANNLPFARLALSLTTADETLRSRLMPVTKANPLSKVREALLLFQKNGGGRVTLEAPLLGGINTREKDAASIAKFAKGLDAVVNIIPWNPVSALEFEGKPLLEPEKKEVLDYKHMLENLGLKVTLRLHKGQKIMGACGQLGSV